MEKCCKNCKFFQNLCSALVPFPEVGCSNFVPRRKRYVLVHRYLESGINSIVAFSDIYSELEDIAISHPRYGSRRHSFYIPYNDNLTRVYFKSLGSIKDKCLIDICKNVAQYFSVGEYAMLKKSYFKSAAWFEKAKNSAALGADIIDNY